MVNVPLCCRCCALVKCGNPELTCNDEFPLFTADNMTFPCAEFSFCNKVSVSLWVGYVPAGGGGAPPWTPYPPPPTTLPPCPPPLKQVPGVWTLGPPPKSGRGVAERGSKGHKLISSMQISENFCSNLLIGLWALGLSSQSEEGLRGPRSASLWGS